MGPTERLYKIKRRLDAGRCLPKTTLLAEPGVSAATLKRDLRHLRERMNAPLVFDRERFGLHDEEARQAWLLRQGQHHGFDLLVAESSARGRLCVSQGQRERRITLGVVLFDGALQATDATAVRHAGAACHSVDDLDEELVYVRTLSGS